MDGPGDGVFFPFLFMFSNNSKDGKKVRLVEDLASIFLPDTMWLER